MLIVKKRQDNMPIKTESKRHISKNIWLLYQDMFFVFVVVLTFVFISSGRGISFDGAIFWCSGFSVTTESVDLLGFNSWNILSNIQTVWINGRFD